MFISLFLAFPVHRGTCISSSLDAVQGWKWCDRSLLQHSCYTVQHANMWTSIQAETANRTTLIWCLILSLWMLDVKIGPWRQALFLIYLGRLILAWCAWARHSPHMEIRNIVGFLCSLPVISRVGLKLRVPKQAWHGPRVVRALAPTTASVRPSVRVRSRLSRWRRRRRRPTWYSPE